MDIKLNGPEIEEFDFDYAVHLWLHGSRHRVVGSAVTTGIQREDAVRILRFPWGDNKIPSELQAEVDGISGELEGDDDSDPEVDFSA